QRGRGCTAIQPQGPQPRSTLRQRLLHGGVTFALGPGAFGTTHVHETFMPAGQGPPSPPLGEAGPYTFVAGDALTLEVREGGRVINAVVLIATGVNNDEHRGCLGMQVATSETCTAGASECRSRPARPPQHGTRSSP